MPKELSNDISIKRIEGVDCYESNGVAYLNLESVILGLGFVDGRNGVVYPRWNRVRKYLEDLKAIPKGADLPEYIPENIFYRLAMKAKNATAEAFQAKVADEIIPAIRKTGKYEVPKSVPSAVEISGPYLRQLREKKGLTIADAARATGVNYQCLAGYERGTKQFTIGKAKRILVYNYLISLPDAVVPLPTTHGLRYVTTVTQRDYPVGQTTPAAPSSSAPTAPDLPFGSEDFSIFMRDTVSRAITKALCDAMVVVIKEVQKRGIDDSALPPSMQRS